MDPIMTLRDALEREGLDVYIDDDDMIIAERVTPPSTDPDYVIIAYSVEGNDGPVLKLHGSAQSSADDETRCEVLAFLNALNTDIMSYGEWQLERDDSVKFRLVYLHNEDLDPATATRLVVATTVSLEVFTEDIDDVACGECTAAEAVKRIEEILASTKPKA